MNLDPVKTSSPGIDCQTPEKTVDVASPLFLPFREMPQRRKLRGHKMVPASLLIPEHAVKVQLDTPEDDIILYQVLDK